MSNPYFSKFFSNKQSVRHARINKSNSPILRYIDVSNFPVFSEENLKIIRDSSIRDIVNLQGEQFTHIHRPPSHCIWKNIKVNEVYDVVYISVKVLYMKMRIRRLYNVYLASKTINLLVLFLYMILYPHSRHLMASLGLISFSLTNKIRLKPK